MLLSSRALDQILNRIELLLGQLNNPSLDKSHVRSLFIESSQLFEQMLNLRQKL
jgi:hypothetical protein